MLMVVLALLITILLRYRDHLIIEDDGLRIVWSLPSPQPSPSSHDRHPDKLKPIEESQPKDEYNDHAARLDRDR
jgi:hypothetical protein